MNKYNEIYNAMVDAMKSSQFTKRDTLRQVIANIKKVAIDRGCKDHYSDDLVNEVLLKEKKTIREMIESCPGDREDLWLDYITQEQIIDEFAPKIISDPSEIEKLIKDTFNDLEFTLSNKGLIMKNISNSLKGKVDMKIASQVVTTLISGGNK